MKGPTEKRNSKKTGRGPGLSKRPDRIETEKKLFDAAILIFSEFGYDGASVHQISETSGVNASLINRYFGGKEGLFYAIAKEYAKRVALKKLLYPPQESVYMELLEYAKVEFADILENKNIIRVIIGKASVDEKFRTEMVANVPFESAAPALYERLKRLQKLGKVRKDVNFKQVQFVLGFQFFSTIFLANMILELETNTTFEMLRNFIETYAKSLEMPS